MDITYLGHSCFKIKGKDSVVVMDPYSKEIGFSLPALSADIVTVSHDHSDHNASNLVKGTARRPEPFTIMAPGEYEIAGTSVFGVSSFHDNDSGKERGKNIMFVVQIDGITVAHLGDLGHMITDKQLEELDGVDVLLCPVGGHYTIDSKVAVEVIAAIQPSYVIPMHFKTDKHNQETYGSLSPLSNFLNAMGTPTPRQTDKLVVSLLNMPLETEVVVLEV